MADDEEHDDKPVEEGKTYEVEIDDLGSKGDGIARVDGFVVFVPDTEVGERVEAEITSVGRRFAFGEVVDRLGTVDGERYEKDEVEEDAVEEAADRSEDAAADAEDEPDEEDAFADQEIEPPEAGLEEEEELGEASFEDQF